MRLKTIPDFQVRSQWDYNFNRSKIYKTLSGRSGIYAYSFRGIIFCIGATQDLGGRGIRFFRKETSNDFALTNLIVKAIKNKDFKGDMSLDIYFYPFKSLGRVEQLYLKKFNPVGHAFSYGTHRYHYADKKGQK